MPTDVSHLPPAPIWFHPYGPDDDRGPPHVIAQREATAAQFAGVACPERSRGSRDSRRLRQEYGQ